MINVVYLVSPIDGHLGHFQFFAIKNNDTLNNLYKSFSVYCAYECDFLYICSVYSVVVEYELTFKSSWLQRTFKLGSLCDVFSWWIIIFDIFWWPDNQGEKYWDFHFKHLLIVSWSSYKLRSWWTVLEVKQETTRFIFILEKCCDVDYISLIYSVYEHWVLLWARYWRSPVIKYITFDSSK